MNRFMITVAFALCGCAGQAPPPIVVDKPAVVVEDRPVPVSCVDKTFPTVPPAFPDAPEARQVALTPEADYSLLAQGYSLHAAWEATLWAQVQACR